MGFVAAVSSGFSKYAKFDGRAQRSEFWWWQLFAVLVTIAASIADMGFGHSFDSNGPVHAISILALFLPSLGMVVRRLHDTGRSGWWYLIAFTIIGIIPLVIWFCSDSLVGSNRYGDNPKQRTPLTGADPLVGAAFQNPASSRRVPLMLWPAWSNSGAYGTRACSLMMSSQ